MKKIFFLLAIPLFLINFSTALSVPAAHAQDAGATDIENQQGFGNNGSIPSAFGSTDEPLDPREIAANLIVGVLGLLGIIFMILLIYAGFRYMTSMGSEEQTSTAKGQIVSAVIGLFIILAAYAITSFVFSCALGATSEHSWTANICATHNY
jgi:hypothetical protein